MKGRAQGVLLTPTIIDAEAIAADVAIWLGGRQKFDQDPEPTALIEEGQPMVVFGVRFDTRLEAEAMATRIRNRWMSGEFKDRILPGSHTSIHSCSHDDNIGDCRTGALRRWVK